MNVHEDNILIRGCNNDGELEIVVELCDLAFPGTNREYFERHMFKDLTITPSDTRILLKNGKIVSSVQVFPRSIYLNGRAINMGGIGNVATHPEERGHGYAGMVLSDAIKYMKEKGMMVSMLTTTINKYYEKFGFRTIKREVCVGSVGDPVPHNNVRKFDQQRDLNVVMQLYEKYNRTSAGPIARDLKYWESQLGFSDDERDLFFVYEFEGKVVAYVRSKRGNDRLKIMEYSFEEQNLELILALLKHAMFEAKKERIELFMSEREKSRLSFFNPEAVQTDTDLMVSFLDSGLTNRERQLLLKENYITFWLTDFF